jgi:hypothetical protein
MGSSPSKELDLSDQVGEEGRVCQCRNDVFEFDGPGGERVTDVASPLCYEDVHDKSTVNFQSLLFYLTFIPFPRTQIRANFNRSIILGTHPSDDTNPPEQLPLTRPLGPSPASSYRQTAT